MTVKEEPSGTQVRGIRQRNQSSSEASMEDHDHTRKTPSKRSSQTSSMMFRRIKVRLNTKHDKYKLHKIMGISCGLHYLYRFYVLLRYGESFFGPQNYGFTLFVLLFHMMLPLTSLMFRVLKYRNPSYWLMIWKEYRFHVIIFTFRSISVALLSLMFAQYRYPHTYTETSSMYSNIFSHGYHGSTNVRRYTTISAAIGSMFDSIWNNSNQQSNTVIADTSTDTYTVVCDPWWLHLMKFVAVMMCHMLADYVTACYGDPTVSTIRCHKNEDENENENQDGESKKQKMVQLDWSEFLVKRFYVVSQFVAIGTLIHPHSTDSAGIDIGFGELYPIHFAAFLMTLQKSGIIDYVTYTICYSLTLFISFTYDSYHMPAVYVIGILAVYYCRCHLRMNKYLLWTLFFIHCQYV